MPTPCVFCYSIHLPLLGIWCEYPKTFLTLNFSLLFCACLTTLRTEWSKTTLSSSHEPCGTSLSSQSGTILLHILRSFTGPVRGPLMARYSSSWLDIMSSAVQYIVLGCFTDPVVWFLAWSKVEPTIVLYINCVYGIYIIQFCTEKFIIECYSFGSKFCVLNQMSQKHWPGIN